MANPFDQFDAPSDPGRFAVSALQTKGNPFDQFDAPGKPSMAWSDVPMQALQNAPQSAANFAHAMVQPILHPIDTAGALLDTAAGGLRAGAKKVLPEGVFNAIDSVDQKTGATEHNDRIQRASDALGGFIASRYGSLEGLKRAIAEDPIGVMADASMVLTAGSSATARLPGALGQAGEAMGQAGRMMNPVQVATSAVKATARPITEALGASTGSSARPITEAFKAGLEGNQTFTDNMRLHRPIADVVDMADNAVGQMGKERNAAYRLGMDLEVKPPARYGGDIPPGVAPRPPPAAVRPGEVPPPPTLQERPMTVQTQPIRQSIAALADSVMHKGVPIDQAATDVLLKIDAIFTQFENVSDRFGHMDIAAADSFKRAVGEIRQRTQQGTLERRVADQVYNNVKGQIVTQIPAYAKVMKDYGEASDAIGEMRKTMSINDKASTDTTLRKLQSTMRSNVQTNYGQREKLLDTLAKYQPDLPAALAGQALNTWAPRGLARQGITNGLIAAAATHNPAALATFPFQSPRLAGELAYGTGAAGRVTKDALARFNKTPESLMDIAKALYASDLAARSQRKQ